MNSNNDALREMRVNKSAPARAKLCETCKHKDVAENAHPCRLCWNPMGDMYEPAAIAARKPEPQAQANTEQSERAELVSDMRTLANTLEALSTDNDLEQNTATTLRKAAALLAADKAVGEVVRYEYRWLNPANNPDEPTSALEWKLVEPRNTYVDTVEDRVRELEAYRYDGKPVYEVRALYTRLQPQTEARPAEHRP